MSPIPLHGLAARALQPADAPALHALRATVLAALPDPDLYVAEADEQGFVARHLDGSEGASLGLHTESGELVAYAMMGRSAAALGEPDAAELASCMVAPAWRGRGLQRELIAARLLWARAAGARRVSVIVSLHNHASRHNLMACGLQVLRSGIWNGLQRQWLGLAFDAQPQLAPTRWVDAEDFGAQQQLAGWRGVAERREGGRTRIGYAAHP
jgi:GNAT superfamily N-acetyltransferase